jgi:hypothetical protein
MNGKVFSHRPILVSLLLGSSFLGLFLTGQVMAAQERSQSNFLIAQQDRAFQPNMQRALYSLIQAQSWLNNATGDRGGHRVKAISLAQQANQEVQLGIQYDIANSGGQNRQPFSRPNIQASSDRSFDSNMRRALSSLTEAKRFLEVATPDKGGHRTKALDLVNQAIKETQAAIQYNQDNGGDSQGKKDANVERALSSLKQAQESLKSAATTYGGHRVKALDLVNQAIKEIQDGVEYNRTHSDK